MNLTKIKDFVYNGDLSKAALRYLLQCGCECEYLDYKSDLDLHSDHGIASFARDVIGMKNVGGGYLVIGIEDKSWTARGLSRPLEFDTKMLRDKVVKATGLSLEVDIVHHQLYTDNGELKTFALILVRGSRKSSKRRNPSICGRNFHHKENWGLREGDIFVRKGDQTIRVTTGDALQELLDTLDAEHERQDISAAQEGASSFDIHDGLFRLLPADYDAFIGRERLREKVIDALERDPRIWIINLHGPGGVGKTALATWIAYDYYRNRRDTYEAILVLSAKEQELTSRGIARVSPTLYSLENLLENILLLFEHGEYCEKPLETQKAVVLDLLAAWRMLLVLDNMEAVADGRIINFIQDLPPKSQTKVLLTSRRRTAGWEQPIEVEQLSLEETNEFVIIRASEMGIGAKDTFGPDDIRDIWKVTGGLPLAIQWTLGRYSISGSLEQALTGAVSNDSPLLEFSFRNSWNSLGLDARAAMAVLSIFQDPPTAQMWSTILEWPLDRLDRAIGELQGMTFIFTKTDARTGTVTYHALPITLTFSKNMLPTFGNMERLWQSKYQQHIQSIELVAQEVGRYDHLFDTFARNENEKRAIVLSRIAEGHEQLNPDGAEEYYQQALDLEPRSVYTLVKYGRFQVSLGRIASGLGLLNEATKHVSRRTGFYVYYNLALAYDSVRHRRECVNALRRALEYEPKHVHARHMLGVTLSRLGEYDEALRNFDELIREELSREGGPSNTLVYALKTKVISLRKSGRNDEARRFLDQGIELVNQHSSILHLARELEEQRFEFE